MIEISNNNNTITRLGIRNTVLNEFVELYTPEKLKNLTVKNFCDKSIKTITKDLKVSFVDFLRSKDIEDDVADATAYVSYTWNTKFLDLVDAINNHFKDKKRVFIWVDIFCLNQHAPITLDLDWWRQLKNTITEIGQIIVVLCPWESPGPLTVSWNLYEIFCAAQSNIRFEATMSKAESKAFITSLHSNFDAIDKMIPKIDVVNGKSLYPYDKESLLDYIRKTEGYDVFDDTVMKKMKGWLIKYIRMGLSEVSDDDDKVRVKITLGKVLRTEELYDESERMFTECLYLPREDRSSKGTVPERKFRLPITHPDRLVAMSSLSFILKKQKNFEKAVALAELCVDESQELFGDSDDRHIQYMGDLADLYAGMCMSIA